MNRICVIIPNWNGAHLLPTCLEALRRQTYGNFETMVVDNASEDGSVALLREGYPEVRVLELPQNLFFSGAVNAGIRASSGEIVTLLNNDTEVEPPWLEELVRALDANPWAGMVACKMLLFDRRDTLNSAGDYYGVNGIPGNRGVWEKDRGQYDQSEEVFGPCGGAAAYRRSMLEDIGLFDEDLVAYCEDVDLNFRAQLAGYRCLYVPTAVVYHRLSASGGGPLASYLSGRNFISVVVKDMPQSLLRKYWPRIVWAQLRYFLHSLLHIREPAARAWIRGQGAGLLRIPLMLHKRRQVRATQRVPDSYLESLLRS